MVEEGVAQQTMTAAKGQAIGTTAAGTSIRTNVRNNALMALTLGLLALSYDSAQAKTARSQHQHHGSASLTIAQAGQAGAPTKSAASKGNSISMGAQRKALQPLESCGASKCSLNFGSVATLGAGTAQAYAFVTSTKTIQEIGVLLSSGVLRNLPQNCGTDKPSAGAKWLICQASASNPNGQMNDTMVTTLDMPRNVVELSNIDKLDISWLPFGHAPEKVWDKPQFDIHFPFRKPTGGQNANLFYTPKVPASQLPAGYMVLPGSGFHWDTDALKGHAHAADPKNSPEFAGGPFLANFLYITYDGNAIGYEVYASTALLNSKQPYDRALDIPESAVGTKNVPSKLRISYEPTLDAYRVSLFSYKELSTNPSAHGSHKH